MKANKVISFFITDEVDQLNPTMIQYPDTVTDPDSTTPQWLPPTNCSSLSGSGYYKGGIRYDVSPTHDYYWPDARAYCITRGGDLAVTGMESLQTRL